MESKLSPEAMRLYRAVYEVLHYVWDPIGVARIPDARDEYESYLPQVFRMVCEGSDERSIAEYLGSIAVGRMGLSPNSDADMEVARLLLEWKACVDLDAPKPGQ